MRFSLILSTEELGGRPGRSRPGRRAARPARRGGACLRAPPVRTNQAILRKREKRTSLNLENFLKNSPPSIPFL